MTEIIRQVKKEEVEQLHAIAKRTFYETFKESYSDKDFEAIFASAYNIEQLEKEVAQIYSFHYFYEVNSKIVGYLKLDINDAQTEDKGDDYLEIQRIYFGKAYQGGGRGKQFIELAIQKAIKYHKSKVWLGVWKHNLQAMDFYDKMDFHVTVTHEFYTGDVIDKDLIMEKVL